MTKFVVVGDIDQTPNKLIYTKAKEKFGDDVVMVTSKEAEKQGLELKDIANVPVTMISPPILIFDLEKTGQEKRRERRKNYEIRININY